MITYTQADSIDDLNGILALQKKNLPRGLSAEEIQSQGFVTVDHTFDQLKKLNDFEKHVIAKAESEVVAYVLAMTKDCSSDIPVLIPMFKVFDKIKYGGKKVSEYNYLVIGQVCVGKEYRGQGIFDKNYDAYKNFYQGKYNFAITEIAAHNTRSLRAHERIGFENIHTYSSPDGVEWIVVLWDWRKSN